MLTFEQKEALRARWYKTGDQLETLWDEAYRLGLLRAAEVCEDLSTGIAHEYAGNCSDAIRAEANDSKTP